MIEIFFLSYLEAQSALGMRHFSFKVQNLPIFKVKFDLAQEGGSESSPLIRRPKTL